MGPDNLPAEPNTTRATLTAALVAALRTPISLCKVFVFFDQPAVGEGRASVRANYRKSAFTWKTDSAPRIRITLPNR